MFLLTGGYTRCPWSARTVFKERVLNVRNRPWVVARETALRSSVFEAQSSKPSRGRRPAACGGAPLPPAPAAGVRRPGLPPPPLPPRPPPPGLGDRVHLTLGGAAPDFASRGRPCPSPRAVLVFLSLDCCLCLPAAERGMMNSLCFKTHVHPNVRDPVSPRRWFPFDLGK